MACDLYNQGKMDECLTLVGGIVRDPDGNVKTSSASAAQASALGIQAALNRYATASKDQKSAALQKLLEVARFTEKNWPNRPEADDARMARGHVKLVDGRPDEAIEVFEQVNPKSDRYSTAMYLAGHTYWLLYLKEKQKSDGRPDEEQMVANRAKAVERLQTALNILKRRYAPGGLMPPYLLETQLLLGEIDLEGGNAKEAAAMFQPLIDSMQAEKSNAKTKTFDASELRVFLGAVRAYCAIHELDRAGAVCTSLIVIGPDTLPVNDALVSFAKLLDVDRKKADARLAELSNSANADEIGAAKAQQSSIRTMLEKMLVQLSQRQELGLGHLIFIGGALNDLGQTDVAGGLFQKILKRTQSDPEFAKRAQKAMSLIRSELLKILRKQKKYDEALQQVDRLIEENPNALEPLMEKGYILEALAEKDPTKYAKAVAHWTTLRNRMQGMLRKPNEYYDVMYNVANCLIREAETSKDKASAVEFARMAEQVLKSPMILTPKLNGPETVAKYKALVDRAILMQGRSPEPKDGNR
jgi:tetratricopeptide (TPR) repeat protein